MTGSFTFCLSRMLNDSPHYFDLAVPAACSASCRTQIPGKQCPQNTFLRNLHFSQLLCFSEQVLQAYKLHNHSKPFAESLSKCSERATDCKRTGTKCRTGRLGRLKMLGRSWKLLGAVRCSICSMLSMCKTHAATPTASLAANSQFRHQRCFFWVHCRQQPRYAEERLTAGPWTLVRLGA